MKLALPCAEGLKLENKPKPEIRRIGILSRLQLLFERNRLGELLVLNGALTPNELRRALDTQKDTGKNHLGRILLQENFISRSALYKALTQQLTLRSMAAVATLVISFAGMSIKPARAGSIKDNPAPMSLASVTNPAFTPIRIFPALFGTNERVSTNLRPFTKWTRMFERFEASLQSKSNDKQIIRDWQADLAAYKDLPLFAMAEKVNDLINRQKYIIDRENWGESDYWATPVEFFTRGGDCEDFAIAKYISLKLLGVPEERMRVAIIHDKIKDIPHAVLIVYTDKGAVLLDNQIKEVRYTDKVSRYRPIFTINRQAWWLHTQPATIVLGSAGTS